MKWFLLLAALLLLLVVSVTTLFIGAVNISVADCFREFCLGETGALSQASRNILLEIRLPRLLAAVMAGASLGVAGVAFQALFRNPLADPYIIGASSGAAFGVTVVIVLGWSVSWFGLRSASCGALAGSVVLTAIVLIVGFAARTTTSTTLLLAGVVISSMINSLVSLLMFINDEKVVVILSWLMGSLAGNTYSSLVTTFLLSALGGVLIFSASRLLDAYLLGDGPSQSLGIDLFSFRTWLVLGGGMLTASSVAAGGVIGFVGLIAPHIARGIAGPSHRWLIPMSACTGGLLLVIADTAARTVVAPVELPVGVMTALMGCPVFLLILVRQPRRPGFSRDQA